MSTHQAELERQLSILRKQMDEEIQKRSHSETVQQPIQEVDEQLYNTSTELEKTKFVLNETSTKLKALNQQYSQEVAGLKDGIAEKDSMIKHLRAQLENNVFISENKYQKELNSLQSTVSMQKKEIEHLTGQLEMCNDIGETSESQKVDFSQKLSHCQDQLEQAEREKLETVKALQQSEREHTKVVQSYRQKIKDQHEKMLKMDRKMKSMEAYAHKQIDNLQESLEREHNVAMEKMKSKMVDLRSNHVASMETLRKQHVAESEELKKQLKAAKDAQQREMVNTPTQVTLHFYPILYLSSNISLNRPCQGTNYYL